MRGNTYDNSVIIVDEFQNMSWHQLNTLISRVGQNSKLILLGDPTQADVTFTKDDPAGMSVLLKSEPFMLSPLSSLSQLKTQYRSAICTLASDMNDYYRKTRITG
jgi:predicted ribonuclease YlaK